MAGDSSPRKWLTLGAINLGNFVTPLDTGIVALILPTISYNLRAPISVVLWIPLSSLLIEAGFMPAFGRLSDRGGRKRYFMIGLVLFALGAFLAGNSLTVYELIIYRVIQSFGAAAVLATGRAIIVDTFGRERRGFALGTNVTSLYIAITIGTLLAATVVNLTQVVGWRFVFYASAAVAAVDVPVCYAIVRESPKNPGKGTDWSGTILFVLALGSVLTVLSEAGQNGFGNIDIFIQEFRVPVLGIYLYPNFLISIPLVYVVVLGLVAGFLFLVQETRSRNPIIDLGMFKRNRLFLSTNLSALFFYVAHWNTLILLSFYLEEIQGLNVLTTGLIIVAEPTFVMIFALIGGWIATRTGSRDPSIVGIGVTAGSLGLLATLTPSTSIFFVVFLLSMMGVGVGLFAPGNTNANLSSVPPTDRGMANGILGMMRFTGQSLSLGIGTLVVGYVALGACLIGGCTFTPGQYTGALQLMFLIDLVLAIAGLLFAYLGREVANSSSIDPER
jgi:MFS family permease